MDVAASINLPMTSRKLLLNQAQKISHLLSEIESYDVDKNRPDIDHIFSKASFIKDRKIDYALYRLAIAVKAGLGETSICNAQANAAAEIDRYLKFFKNKYL